MLIAEDDYEALEASVESYDNFDQLKLAEDLEARLLPRCMICVLPACTSCPSRQDHRSL